MPLCVDLQMWIYIYVYLLLNIQNNYCKWQPLMLMMLKLVIYRYNHWNTSFCDNLVGFFFF